MLYRADRRRNLVTSFLGWNVCVRSAGKEMHKFKNTLGSEHTRRLNLVPHIANTQNLLTLNQIPKMDTQTAIVISIGMASAAGLAGYCVKNFRKGTETGVKTVGEVAKPVAEGIGKIADGMGNIFQAAADWLNTKTKELNQLRVENQNLTSDLERIKNQKVNVNSVEMIFKVALATFDMQYTDFQKKVLSEESSKIARNEKVEYIGVIRKDYKQTLGVDFKKLRFVLEGRNIFVKGLFDVEVIGFKDAKTTPLLTEKRTFKSGATLMWDTTTISGGYEAELVEQLAFIEERMSRNKFAEDVDRAIGNMALSMIQLFVGQTYNVKSVEKLDNAVDFVHLLNVINTQRDAEAQAIVSQIELNEQKVQSIEKELALEYKNIQGQLGSKLQEIQTNLVSLISKN